MQSHDGDALTAFTILHIHHQGDMLKEGAQIWPKMSSNKSRQSLMWG
jgi:hypothetical protein